MMKKTLITLLALCSFFFVQAQDDDTGRKGKFLVETGYNVIGGLTAGSGASVLIADGETLTSLGADMGYFLGRNFALKFRLAVLSSGGNSITNFGAGLKYYIIGLIPIEAGIGAFGNGDDSVALINLSGGYAIQLASNINLEPSIGIIASDGDILTNLKINFALFF